MYDDAYDEDDNESNDDDDDRASHGKVLVRGKANSLIFSGQLVVDVI